MKSKAASVGGPFILGARKGRLVRKPGANSQNRRLLMIFPCKPAPVREFEVETGLYLTARATIHVHRRIVRASSPPPGISGKAPRFDLPDELQRWLGKAPAGGSPKDRRQAVATPEHRCVRAMGGGVAQELFEFFALSYEAWSVKY